jgi:hypothetical protein
MALIWLDGFDTTTTPGEHYENSSGTGTITGRTGNALHLNGGGTFIQKTVASAGTYYAGFAFRLTNRQDAPVIQFREGTTTHVDLRFSAAGIPPMFMQVTRAGTQLGSNGATSFALNTWYYIEVKAIIHDTTGAVEVKVNGVTEFNLTNQDTRNGLTGIIDNIKLEGFQGTQIDDLWIDSSQFHGDCKVETLRPTGAGNSTQFTPSAGSNWQNVDDTTHDGDTTYNASSTNGHIDLFALGDLVTATGTVEGIKVVQRWRKDDAGSRTARRVIRTGATNYEGGDVSMSDSYTTSTEVIEQNPNTTADWTIANVNGLEAGYKLQA